MLKTKINLKVVKIIVMRQKGLSSKQLIMVNSYKIITILNEHGAKVPLTARRAKKVKTGLQAQTQLFVYGLFIYNQWRGMGTLNLERHH